MTKLDRPKKTPPEQVYNIAGGTGSDRRSAKRAQPARACCFMRQGALDEASRRARCRVSVLKQADVKPLDVYQLRHT